MQSNQGNHHQQMSDFCKTDENADQRCAELTPLFVSVLLISGMHQLSSVSHFLFWNAFFARYKREHCFTSKLGKIFGFKSKLLI